MEYILGSDANYDEMATVTPAFRGGLVTPPRNTAEDGAYGVVTRDTRRVLIAMCIIVLSVCVCFACV
jgi:hypothetical protein